MGYLKRGNLSVATENINPIKVNELYIIFKCGNLVSILNIAYYIYYGLLCANSLY